ncbi:unnamed protein product, partial [Musa textilis]
VERLAAETQVNDREGSSNSLIGRWWEGAMRGTMSWEGAMGLERAASLRSPKRKRHAQFSVLTAHATSSTTSRSATPLHPELHHFS